MYSTTPRTPTGPVTHEQIRPEVLHVATNPGPSVPLALLAAAAYSYGKAMGDEHTHFPRYLLATLRVLPSILLFITTLQTGGSGNRTYVRAIAWGLALCAAGDALIEMDPAFRVPIGGDRHLRLLSFGLALFVAAHAAFGRAMLSDTPPPASKARRIAGAHLWAPALLILLYRIWEFSILVPLKSPLTGVSPELLGVVDWKRFRMVIYTISTSALLTLALARCFAPPVSFSGSKIWAVIACCFYVASDSLLTYARHVKPFPFSEGAFLMVYSVGQTCMAMSVSVEGKEASAEEQEEETKETTKQVRTRHATKSKKVE